MEQQEQQLQQAARNAEKLVETTMAGRDASHDAAHAFRVRDLALSLAKEEGLDDHKLEIVEIAALLHDIGDYKYTEDGKEDLMVVEKFLDEEKLDESKKDRILSIIKGMGHWKCFFPHHKKDVQQPEANTAGNTIRTCFKNEVAQISCDNSSFEFGVVQDADRLDAIGAIGIARCFTYGGSKNNMLHDPEILPRTDLSKEKYMDKNGKQTSINHFHEKLFKLKSLMKTKAGKRRAEKRHKFMQDFVAEFYEEWSGRA